MTASIRASLIAVCHFAGRQIGAEFVGSTIVYWKRRLLGEALLSRSANGINWIE